MAYQFKFEKIMNLKEREKDEVLSNYNESVKRFEEAAESLFRSLKKKEDLESYQRSKKLDIIKPLFITCKRRLITIKKWLFIHVTR